MSVLGPIEKEAGPVTMRTVQRLIVRVKELEQQIERLTGTIRYLEFAEMDDPKTPADASKLRLFLDKSSGELSIRKSNGTTYTINKTP